MDLKPIIYHSETYYIKCFNDDIVINNKDGQISHLELANCLENYAFPCPVNDPAIMDLYIAKVCSGGWNYYVVRY